MPNLSEDNPRSQVTLNAAYLRATPFEVNQAASTFASYIRRFVGRLLTDQVGL